MKFIPDDYVAAYFQGFIGGAVVGLLAGLILVASGAVTITRHNMCLIDAHQVNMGKKD